MLTIRAVGSMFLVAMIILGAGTAPAQDYPSKPIRISTVQTGGGTDFVARLIANGITGPLGQPVIVENRPTQVAIDIGMKAPPDGYTILILGSTLWTQVLVQSKPLWDPVNDFAPITVAVSSPLVVIVHPSLPVKSIKELIALAKARPGELNYAHGIPAGSLTHLAHELFKSMAGVNILGVPYKGSGSALNALLGGEAQMGIENTVAVSPHLKSGKVKALGISSLQPSPLMPGLPTVSASGLPGFQATTHQGIWAPAKTPAPVIRRLNQEMVRYLNQADAKQKILDTGSEPGGNSPEEFAALIKSDLVKWGKVVKEAGIKVE